MSGTSYDPNMEKYPLLISYPRSGSNWLNCVLEVYFDRPRLRAGHPTFIKNFNKRKDYMWFHDHDIPSDLIISHDNIMYLYRNPDDVIYSLLKAEHPKITDQLVNKQIRLLTNHYNKYLVGNIKPKVITKYESLKDSNYQTEFSKIIKHLGGKDIDKDKLDAAIKMVVKDQVVKKQIDKRYFNEKMLKKRYEVERKAFKEQYGKRIENQLTSKYWIFF